MNDLHQQPWREHSKRVHFRLLDFSKGSTNAQGDVVLVHRGGHHQVSCLDAKHRHFRVDHGDAQPLLLDAELGIDFTHPAEVSESLHPVAGAKEVSICRQVFKEVGLLVLVNMIEVPNVDAVLCDLDNVGLKLPLVDLEVRVVDVFRVDLPIGRGSVRMVPTEDQPPVTLTGQLPDFQSRWGRGAVPVLVHALSHRNKNRKSRATCSSTAHRAKAPRTQVHQGPILPDSSEDHALAPRVRAKARPLWELIHCTCQPADRVGRKGLQRRAPVLRVHRHPEGRYISGRESQFADEVARRCASLDEPFR